MPVNILCAFIVGSALGWILIKITRPAKQLKGLILGCCAAGQVKIFVITHYQTFFRRIDASISQDITGLKYLHCLLFSSSYFELM